MKHICIRMSIVFCNNTYNKMKQEMCLECATFKRFGHIFPTIKFEKWIIVAYYIISSQQLLKFEPDWPKKKCFTFILKSFFHVNYFLYVNSTAGCLQHSRAVRFFKSPTDFRFYLRKRRTKKRERMPFSNLSCCGKKVGRLFREFMLYILSIYVLCII